MQVRLSSLLGFARALTEDGILTIPHVFFEIPPYSSPVAQTASTSIDVTNSQPVDRLLPRFPFERTSMLTAWVAYSTARHTAFRY